MPLLQQASLLKTPPSTTQLHTQLNSAHPPAEYIAKVPQHTNPVLGSKVTQSPPLSEVSIPLEIGLQPSLSPLANASLFHGPNSCPTIDPNRENPVMSLPTEIIYGILEKIPAPTLDCSNPFTMQENCSLAEPTSSTSNSKNLVAAQHNDNPATLDPHSSKLSTLPPSIPPPWIHMPQCYSHLPHLSTQKTETRSHYMATPSSIPSASLSNPNKSQVPTLVVALSSFRVKEKRKTKIVELYP